MDTKRDDPRRRPGGFPAPLRLLCLALVASGLLGCAPASSRSLLSLIQTPLHDGQHDEVAERYREKAEEARRLATYHLALAARYRGWQQSPEGAAGTGAGLAAHCEALAHEYERAAQEYEALAAAHRSLAAADAAGATPRLPYDRDPVPGRR